MLQIETINRHTFAVSVASKGNSVSAGFGPEYDGGGVLGTGETMGGGGGGSPVVVQGYAAEFLTTDS